jgi:hypothetical protein
LVAGGLNSTQRRRDAEAQKDERRARIDLLIVFLRLCASALILPRFLQTLGAGTLPPTRAVPSAVVASTA